MAMREMKDSGIPWVGKVPSSWEIMCGKYLFSNTKEIVGTKVNDYERLALTLHGVIKRSKNDTEGLQPEDFNTYQILRENELVFKLIDLQNISTSRVGLSPYDGIVSPAYIVLKAKENVIPSFAEKYYLMMWMNQIFNALGDAGVRSSLNVYELLEIKVPVPPVHEQHRIANYLDTRCSQIDSIRKNVEAEIEALKQYKQSVITEAVTKGLDKNVEMKDSGIPWAKQIPSHWEVMPNKYLMHKVKRICPVYNGENILSLTMQGVIIRDFDLGGKMPATFDGYQIIYPGNLLMCLFDYDVTPRCIGLIKNKGLTSPAYSQFVMNKSADAHYYYYYYLMLDFTKELLHLAKNLRHSFTEEQLGQINTVIPPLTEQRRIADYLDTKCAKIDSIIQKKQELLINLDAYKKSLIYEYVTGKKEVPAV